MMQNREGKANDLRESRMRKKAAKKDRDCTESEDDDDSVIVDECRIDAENIGSENERWISAKSDEKTKKQHVANSNKSSHVANSEKSSHVANSEKSSHVANSNKSSHVANRNKSSHVSSRHGICSLDGKEKPKSILLELRENRKDPRAEISLRDERLCRELLDMNFEEVDYMIEYLCTQENLAQDEERKHAANKFTYEEGDSYDWHLALGCLNCGASFNVYELESSTASPCLLCTYCGHRICSKHYDYQTESFADQFKQRKEQEETAGATYLYGFRKQHNFGQHSKRFWQDRYCCAVQKHKDGILHEMKLSSSASKRKGATCEEECRSCGHNRAYYKCFQARSADEGLTIMFECCKCGNRTVVNS